MCFMSADQRLPGSIPETRRRRSVTKADRTGIRFSESEWQEVKAAAELHDVPAA